MAAERRGRALAVAAGAVAAACLAGGAALLVGAGGGEHGAPSPPPPPAPPAPPVDGGPEQALRLTFGGGDRVLATEHGNDDPDVELTSGSLYVEGGHAWSGPLDAGSRRPASAVLRARTRADRFGDVAVTVEVRNDGLDESADVPAHPYDGISLGLRYQSEDELYYVNVHRRDGTITIKRKAPDGEGEPRYTTLATAERDVPYGTWESVTATARTVDGGVELTVAFDGVEALRAVDAEDPILEPGRILVRGDNCEFAFDDLTATPLT